MAKIEITGVYKISDDRRHIEVAHFDDESDVLADVNMTLDDLQRPFFCAGISERDLAVFGTLIDDDGVSSFDGLVTSVGETASEVMTSDLLEIDPSRMTAELAEKIIGLDLAEIAQLGIARRISEAAWTVSDCSRSLGPA